MPKVEFRYDIFKDGGNIYRVLTSQPLFDKDNESRVLKGLEIGFIEQVKKEENSLKKQEIIANYLIEFLSQNKNFIEEKIKSFSEQWGKINDRYFEKLSSILDIKIPQNNIYIVYLTNAGSCPFNVFENWLMVRLKDKKIDTTVAHEIMHIEFVKVYGYLYRNSNLLAKQFNDFREAITVLLNEECGDILSRPDYGYQEHQELRNKILELWRKDKNFKNLIDNSLKFLK